MPRSRTISDEAVLDAVLTLAHRVGPSRVTFAAAAAETGLSAATLVQRFGTKRELLLAADKRAVDLWVSAWDRTTETSPLAQFAVRARVVAGLVEARAVGELRTDTDVTALAKTLETTYHGAMIGWAIHREGALSDWMRDQIGVVLAPHCRTPTVR